MHFLMFRLASDSRLRVGVALNASSPVLDVTAATSGTGCTIKSMRTLFRLIYSGPEDDEERAALAAYEALIAGARSGASEHTVGGGVTESGGRADLDVRAPIYDPEKVICVGMNYVDHCTEQGFPIPEEPLLFSKFPSTIRAGGDEIAHPSETVELDFEVELVIVVGKGGRRIPKEEALSHVAGYTVAHDVSARDWQLKRNGGQWLLGKTFDGFCPLGPAIVSPDELGDAHNLRLWCKVNGETVQDSNTNQLIFKTEDVIHFASQFVTLNPGDLILTGTPPGVGCFRKPPLWLKPGDEVEVGVEKLGTLTNKIIPDDSKPTAAAAGGGTSS